MSISLVDTFASFERLPPLDTSDVADELPRDYTAVRFYFNESFPDNEENKLFVTRLLQTLTEAGDVVLLNPDLHIDDHWEMAIGKNPRIHSVDHLMTPAQQPRDPDEGDQPRARVRRHLRRAVVSGADVRRDLTRLLLASREVLAAAPRARAPRVRRLQARLLRGARHERHRRARARLRRARPADAGARTDRGGRSKDERRAPTSTSMARTSAYGRRCSAVRSTPFEATAMSSSGRGRAKLASSCCTGFRS